MDVCVDCGETVFEDTLRCEDCLWEPETVLSECSLCGHEFDPEFEGEYDTCGYCLDEMDDED